MQGINRRKFMKNAVIMGTAMTALPATLFGREPAVNVPKTVVHPNVDNLKVVGIFDEAMTRDQNPYSSWATQEELVVPKAVWENICSF